MWRDEWGGHILFSHGSVHSKGTLILFKPNFDINIQSEVCDENGRFIILNLDIQDINYVFINIYSPNKEKDKNVFWKTMCETMKTMNINRNDNIIAGGDWNSIFNPELDKSGGKAECSNKVSSEFFHLMDDYDLVDIWRLRNPNKKRFTFRQKTPLVQTRLDYFLTSSNIQETITVADIIPSVWSDHSAIAIGVKHMPQNSKGPGYWKFNSLMADDQIFVADLNRKIKKWEFEYKNIVDKRTVWELIKFEIRNFSIKYGARKKKIQKQELDHLLLRLNKLESEMSDSAASQQNYYEVTEKIKMIEKVEAQGIIVRSKVQLMEENEKCTKFFFDIEKSNYVKKHIRKLEIDGKGEVTDPGEILQYEKIFYQELYTECIENETVNSSDLFIQDMNKLTDDQRVSCEGNIDKHECLKVLKTFKSNKSPGNDGLTMEFYAKFWNVICDRLIDSYNESFDKGMLSVSQRQAIITLLQKKDKDKLLLKNWRPISLLNLDYKILTKVFAIRMKKVLPFVIHHNQTGFVEGRRIVDSIRIIQDIMNYTKQNKLGGMLLFIDFEKAFDSINWTFMLQALKCLNFGQNFIKWIHIFYTDISSCIINNGSTSKYFPVSRGVRQGDPLSPYLFIVVTEFLASRIRSNANIKGFIVNNNNIKLTMYADDTTAFVADEQSANCLFAELENFRKASGLKINIEKTEGLWLGSNANSQKKPFGIKWST